MLILFLATDYRLLDPFQQNKGESSALSIVIAQSGVYELQNIIHNTSFKNIYALKQDLEVSGLLTRYAKDERISIIDYPEFVTLSTQQSPCITVQ